MSRANDSASCTPSTIRAADDGSTGRIAADFLTCVARIDAADPLPPVRALHLPPPSAHGTREGEFCAIELADGAVGLSYVLLGDTLPALLAWQPRAALAGMSTASLAAALGDADPVRRTLGVAAINAISQRLFARAGYVPPDATDSIGGITPAPGERVGMVGLFPGLAERIVGRGARLVVLELDARLAGERDGYVVTLDPAALDDCTQVMSTTTLLLNNTLEPILARCRSASRLALVGPGGSCLPDPLFTRGVTSLGGLAMTDAPAFLAALVAGRPWGGFTRRYTITRTSYPGLDALLAQSARAAG